MPPKIIEHIYLHFLKYKTKYVRGYWKEKGKKSRKFGYYWVDKCLKDYIIK